MCVCVHTHLHMFLTEGECVHLHIGVYSGMQKRLYRIAVRTVAGSNQPVKRQKSASLCFTVILTHSTDVFSAVDDCLLTRCCFQSVVTQLLFM